MKSLFFILVMGASLTLASCDGSHLVVGTQLSAPAYDRPVAPGPDYIWVDGDWYVEGGQYVWREGHWDRPRGHRTWHGGGWENKGDGWYWRRGRWH